MQSAQPPSGRVITLTLPVVTPLLNTTLRQHWSRGMKAKRALAWEVRVALGRQRPPAPFARAKVRIERHSVGTPDQDGLVGGMKGLIDCLLPVSKVHPLGLGLVADDNPTVMQLEAVAVRAASRADQKTVVTIWELLGA